MATMPPKQDVLVNERFTLNRTTSIFYQHTNQIDGPIASGTFFEIDGRIFLITAQHTFDDFDVSKIRVPQSPASDELIDLGTYDHLFPKEKEYDVCALEITDFLKKKQLRQGGWQFLSVSNVITAPGPHDDFLLFGYPYAIKNEGRTINTYHPLSAYASRRSHIPEEAKDLLPNNLDLFFEYGPIADALDGSEVETAALYGASGCSVWQVVKNPSLWMPPRVIGVQVAFFKNKYFRAVSWTVVARLLALADVQLGEKVQRALSV